MSGYAPGRDHSGNKEVAHPDSIARILEKRKPGFTVVWSAGHTKGAARVKAFRANKGMHPAWKEYDAGDYRFTIVESVLDTGGWNVAVQREAIHD